MNLKELNEGGGLKKGRKKGQGNEYTSWLSMYNYDVSIKYIKNFL
jgi:hypothetical protein